MQKVGYCYSFPAAGSSFAGTRTERLNEMPLVHGPNSTQVVLANGWRTSNKEAEPTFHARREMGPALALQLANYKQLGLEVLGKVCLGES